MAVAKNLSFLMLACLTILALHSTPTMACTCLKTSPQTHYCKSDYVVLARIKSKFLVEDRTAYAVEYVKKYKTTPAGEKTLANGRFLTPPKGNSCSIDLTVGELYVIAAKGSSLNLCSYIRNYKSMSDAEKNNISQEYPKKCSKN